MYEITWTRLYWDGWVFILPIVFEMMGNRRDGEKQINLIMGWISLSGVYLTRLQGVLGSVCDCCLRVVLINIKVTDK